MTAGEHTFTVSPARGSNKWGNPVNTNPYFTNGSNGWTLAPVSGWANGSVEVSSMSATTPTPYAGQKILWRVACDIRSAHTNVDTKVTPGKTHTFLDLNTGFRILTWEETRDYAASVTSIAPTLATWSDAPQMPNPLLIEVQSYEVFFYDETAYPIIDLSQLTDTIDIRHGRDDPSDQPEASTATIELSWNEATQNLAGQLDIGATVNVSTAYPYVDPATFLDHDWTGTPDASTSTRTSVDGVLTNETGNPNFRNDVGKWQQRAGFTVTWVATGGVNGGSYGHSVSDGTGVGAMWAPLGLSTTVPVPGSVACWNFWAKPVGGYPGFRLMHGTWTVASYTFSGSAWQHFIGTAVVPATGADSGVWSLTYPAGYAQPNPAGAGIDLDAVMWTFLPSPAWKPPFYFDGWTADVIQQRSTRFVGRVTDMHGGWDEAGAETPNATTMQVVCAGFSADLGRRIVGDEAWPMELDAARVARILQLAGMYLDPSTTPDPGTVLVLPRDIDSQAALGLATETAADAGGVLWYTRQGQTRYADADHRTATVPTLVLDDADISVTPTWERNTQALVNKVAIGYGLPPAGGGDQPRYRAQDTVSINRWGQYAVTADTILANLSDATERGTALLARNSVPAWVLNSLPIDVGDLTDDKGTALLALDMHGLVSVTLPKLAQAPQTANLWVEGWTEHLAWGVHTIELAVSEYSRTAATATATEGE